MYGNIPWRKYATFDKTIFLELTHWPCEKFPLVFSLTMTANEPPELGRWDLVWREITNISENYI